MNPAAAVAYMVVATGLSSVATQLLAARELLTRFSGNEFVISLVLFSWLVLGGLGTLAAKAVENRPKMIGPRALGWLGFVLAACSPLTILLIRLAGDAAFIAGVSVGFYSTFWFIFLTLCPYALLVGFLLPYSLYVLRDLKPDDSTTRVYILDNLGDVAGGALFAFVLVRWATPLAGAAICAVPLIFASWALFSSSGRISILTAAGLGATCAVLLAGPLAEPVTLDRGPGTLEQYTESRYGRIIVKNNDGQRTLFADGTPLLSTRDFSLAESAIHYPLSQVSAHPRVLVVSAVGGMMAELKKYKPAAVDYVELDPEIAAAAFKYHLITPIAHLRTLNTDARAFLQTSQDKYNAVILNLPEPETFQLNRFFTFRFFSLVKKRLASGGVLSFSLEGFDNYMPEPVRQKLSMVLATVSRVFSHVALIPGERIYFLCADKDLDPDICALLAKKKIPTQYISAYFYGDVTPERRAYLMGLLDKTGPVNQDKNPRLMGLIFSQWFLRHNQSPWLFFGVFILVTAVYLVLSSKPEFILFTTGFSAMAGEILALFAFQIYFGYVYFHMGMIITVFLAGLLPGAMLGNYLKKGPLMTDAALVLVFAAAAMGLEAGGALIRPWMIYAFGAVVSFLTGLQFPSAYALFDNAPFGARKSFFADLLGAGCGVMVTSVMLIPYLGVVSTGLLVCALKLASLKGSVRI